MSGSKAVFFGRTCRLVDIQTFVIHRVDLVFSDGLKSLPGLTLKHKATLVHDPSLQKRHGKLSRVKRALNAVVVTTDGWCFIGSYF